jgi:uncharacterized membrane protein
MTLSNLTLLLTTICVGLMAGVFYAYSCSVMPGLSRLPDREFLAAMQSINRAIQNPVFFISFFGALVLLPVCSFMKFGHPLLLSSRFIIAATLVYLIGAFGVTVFGNIPLNNSLDKFDYANASGEALNLQRAAFEAKWNSLNLVRALSSVISFILVVIACIYNFAATPNPQP